MLIIEERRSTANSVMLSSRARADTDPRKGWGSRCKTFHQSASHDSSPTALLLVLSPTLIDHTYPLGGCITLVPGLNELFTSFWISSRK